MKIGIFNDRNKMIDTKNTPVNKPNKTPKTSEDNSLVSNELSSKPTEVIEFLGELIDRSIEGLTTVKLGKVVSEGGAQPDGLKKNEIRQNTPVDSENRTYYVAVIDTKNGKSSIKNLSRKEGYALGA